MGKFSAGVTTYFAANIKGFRTGFNNASKSMSRFQKDMKKSVGKIKSAFGGLGTVIGAGVVLQGFRQMTQVFKEFETATDGLAAVLGKTSDEMVALIDDAKRLGATTQFTAKEVAGLQTEFAKFGFTEQEILNATGATLNLAAATKSDLSEAATIAAATLRGFGLDASQTTRLTDVMAKSFSTSALDLNKFQESMKFVAPVAKAAGLSVEETTAMLGKLADAGVSGSQAGTALRRILSEMAKTGKPASEALRDVAERGVTLASAQDEVGRSAQTALLILSEQMDGVNELTETFENAAGAAEEMAAKMLDNWTGDLTQLSSAWEGVVLGFEDGSGRIATALRGATQWLTFMVKQIGFLDKYGGTLSRSEMSEVEQTIETSGDRTRTKFFGDIESGTQSVDDAIAFVEKRITALQSQLEKAGTAYQKYFSDAALLDAQKMLAELQAMKAGPVSGGGGSPVGDGSTGETAVNLTKLAATPIPPGTILSDGPGLIDSINFALDRVAANNWLTKFVQDLKKGATAMINVGAAIEGAAHTIVASFETLIGGMAEGGNSAGDIMNDILMIVANFIGQFGKMLIGAAVAAIQFKNLLANPLAALAAGLALVGISAALKGFLSQGIMGGDKGGSGGGRPPMLAAGGLAFGETLAVVGDNMNAGSDPEVIAPLSQLKKYMNNSSGRMTVQITGRLRGREIWLSNNDAQRDVNRRR